MGSWYRIKNLNKLFNETNVIDFTSSTFNTQLFINSLGDTTVGLYGGYRQTQYSYNLKRIYNNPTTLPVSSDVSLYPTNNYIIKNESTGVSNIPAYFGKLTGSINTSRAPIIEIENTFLYKNSAGNKFFYPSNNFIYNSLSIKPTDTLLDGGEYIPSVILNGSYIIKYNITELEDIIKSFNHKMSITFNGVVTIDGVRVYGFASNAIVSATDYYTEHFDEIPLNSIDSLYFTTYSTSYANNSVVYYSKLINNPNSILTFDNVEVHEDFAKFLLAIADSQDQIVLTFGDSVVLANKPVNEISVVKKTLNLVDVTIDGVTSEVEIHPQEDKVFLGFSLQENSTVATIPIGTTRITLNENTVFYEVWGTYKPEPNFFTANFYKNSAESHRVDKTEYLTSVFSAGISLREETNIIYPTILLQYDKVPDFNYCYIEYFGRYYYVRDITSIRNNIWQISLSVDVLMSFKDTIKTQMGNVIRQENIGNVLMQDTSLPVLQNPSITYVDFGSNTFDQEFKQFVDNDVINFVVVTQGEELQI